MTNLFANSYKLSLQTDFGLTGYQKKFFKQNYYCNVTSFGVFEYFMKKYDYKDIIKISLEKFKKNVFEKKLYFFLFEMRCGYMYSENYKIIFPGHYFVIEKLNDKYYLHQSFIDTYSYIDWINSDNFEITKKKLDKIISSVKYFCSLEKDLKKISKNIANITNIHKNLEIEKIDDDCFKSQIYSLT